MKTSILCIAFLLGSVTSPLFAQKNASESTDDSKSTVFPFANAYSGLLQPSTLEVRLSKGNVLLLASPDYEQSRLLQRPDSLVRLFWNEYGETLDKLPDDTEGTSVHYMLNPEDAPYVLWRKYVPTVSEYTVLDKELIRVKSVQDTLQISIRGDEKQRAELFLIVNDLRDLPLLFDEIRIKTAFLLNTLEKKVELRKLERSNRVFASYRGDRNVRYTRGVDRLESSLKMSLGNVRGQWATGYGVGLSYKKEGAQYGPRFEYMSQQFYRRNGDGKITVDEQGFLMLGVTHFSKPKDISRENGREVGYLTLGYLTERNGDYYNQNTWRVGLGYTFNPRLSVEGEWYYTGFFKEVSYGLRLVFNVF